MAPNKIVLVAEDDPWARLIAVVLDPTTSAERSAAFADFMSPDLSDFRGWCDKVRSAAAAIYPSEVRLVGTQDKLRGNLATADAIFTEALTIGPPELAAAPRLKAVHKYGIILRNIGRRLRRTRRQGAGHPPARQHRVRRARFCLDASAGAAN